MTESAMLASVVRADGSGFCSMYSFSRSSENINTPAIEKMSVSVRMRTHFRTALKIADKREKLGDRIARAL